MRTSIAILFSILSALVTAQSIPYSFRQGQYYPNKGDVRVSETNSAGAIRDVIRRNSARSRKVLVRNTNSAIEYQKEDARYMTSRAKSKVDILASLVRSRWNSQIRVQEAWTDAVDKNNLFSLHYEGRALLVQLTNRDRNRLSDLMKLAIEAGFDFVHYKNSDFIHISVKPDICQTKLDLGIVVDTSGSVGIHNHRKIQNFLKKLIDFFNVGRDETHIALISYSYSVKVEFGLNSYYDKFQLKQAVDRMWYQGANTATGDALRQLQQNVFQRGGRQDKSIPKIGILITDGRSNGGYNVYRAASEVKNAGINMFVIGVTGGVRRSETDAISSTPVSEHYFHIQRFTDLSGFVDQISTQSCNEGAQISKCENAETEVGAGSFKYFRVEITSSVNIEVVDVQGRSYLYTSEKSKNPGPLTQNDNTLKRNEGNVSPRTISIDNRYAQKKIIYISVQGQLDNNKFKLNIWDSLFPNDQVTESVMENSPAGQLVTTVRAKPGTGRFRYYIKDGNSLGHFNMDQNGNVKTTRSLDREAIPMYQLGIVAQDVNVDCHKGLMSLIVNVGDKDDNKPKFEKDLYEASIREDVALNQYVITVKATDKDTGTNAQLRYEIYEPRNDLNVFKMNPTTGVVTTAQTFDYETRQSYELKLRVKDMGSVPDYGYAILRVKVIDVNEPPRFVSPSCMTTAQSCRFSVNEESVKGTKVGQTIQARDPDKLQNCQLVYDIISNDNRYFAIGKYTGVITIKDRIDRETKEYYSLEVRVSDCYKPPASSKKVIRVQALDVNDNKPIFQYPNYNKMVPENTNLKTNVLTVKATDLDAGRNKEIVYSITNSDASGTFSINQNTGVITLEKALDRETKSRITLEITARDKGVPSLSSAVQVVFTIGDYNDNKPVIGNLPNQKVRENIAQNTHVFTVTATDRDAGLNAQIRFSIVSGNTNNAFKINDNGRVYTAGPIDRERVDAYTLQVKAQDLGKPSLFSLRNIPVQILDENDNNPVFGQSVYRKSVKENLALNSKIVEVQATDRDIGTNAEIEYSITAGDNGRQFNIDKTSGLITLKAKLDYATKNSYQLKVKAIDKGTPSLSGTATVIVTVQDSNDFRPKFSTSNYNVQLNENVPKNTPVVTVVATDDDTGTSGEIFFTIKTQPAGNKFYIDSKSGVIATRASIDYESKTSYRLTVEAKDKGTPALAATSTVNVQIIDLNDNAPDLKPVSVTIPEDRRVSSVIKQLTATDRDSGSNAEIFYSIQDNTVPFTVKANGEVAVTKVLDRETTDYYKFLVRATDKGVPSLYTDAYMEVRITDINDNDPKFKTSPYSCSVYENAPQGTHVCYIEATDRDIGENARIIYSISASWGDSFQINPSNGAITTKKPIDRETRDSFTFTATASDNGATKRSSTTSVVVKIKDENDNTPVFDRKKYAYDIVEESVGTVNDVISATDRDIGKNAEIVFSIISGHRFADGERFSVKNTGQNKMQLSYVALDREDRDKYSLTIKAVDKGRPSLSATVVVDVRVTDINDNNPILTENTYTGNVKESVAVGTYVLTVSASDRDIGTNAQTEYRLIGGANRDHFKLDLSTGVLVTAKKLDYETLTKYEFDMRVNDKGNPTRTDTAKIVVNIQNVDDNAPKFDKFKPVSLSEDIGLDHPVVQFSAFDADGSPLTFSIIGGNQENKFKIDPKTGLMRTQRYLDRETTDKYTIKVSATDGTTPVSDDLSVTILDVNDNRPKFTKSSYSGEIDENAASSTFVYAVGNVILKVLATDRDIGKNAEIEYSIVGGNIGDAFSIASDSGEIRAAKSLDREKLAAYTLRVAATDKGTPSLQSDVAVNIKVKDLNDNRPKFEQDSYAVTIAENTGINANVQTVQARDIDEGDNAKVAYRITKNSMNAFKIDSTSGQVRTVINLDRETKAKHEITIEAYDHGSKPLRSEVKMIITVSDMNDNAPVITSPVSFQAVNESVSVNTKIATITATDADEGVNANCIYQVRSDGDFFTIDRRSGEVYLAKALDRETKDTHKVYITVHDEGSPQQITNKVYDLTVLDDNDNKPVFKEKNYQGSIDENKAGRNKVFTVQATDADINENAKILFSLTNNFGGAFEINANNGEVFALKPFDYETKKDYELEIYAKDWKYSSKVKCVVSVNNLNDNSPKFNPANYQKTIAEDAKTGLSVVTVTATDPDPFGELEYAIDHTKPIPFDIDSRTGEISVSGGLDYETTKQYSFKVTAADQGNPQLFGETMVTVDISDVNDNDPLFYNYSAVVSIDENKPKDTLVFKLTATDLDSGKNAEIRYEAIDKNNKDFTVDFRKGDVTTLRPFDREQESTLVFKYRAKDLGIPQRQSKVFVLTVNIIDLNDNDPKWDKDSYTASVIENSPQNTLVVRVKADDIDQNENGLVSYSLVDPDKKFDITDQGVVVVKGALDREQQDNYEVTLVASDNGAPKRSSQVKLRVTILDANDNAPVFVPSTLQAFIFENELPTDLTTVNATDADIGINAEIEYAIEKNDMFSINSKTGHIKTLRPLDREEKSQHIIKVTAYDKGTPRLSTIGNLTVTIKDKDDNCPVFESKVYTATVEENSPFGTFVVQVKATDADEGENAELNFGIVESNDRGAFMIDKWSGKITVAGQVDLEYTSLYQLKVRAGSLLCGLSVNDTNVGEGEKPKPQNYTITEVLISVTDVNDMKPTFHNKNNKVYFNDMSMTDVIQLNATDADSGLGGKVGYRLKEVKQVEVGDKTENHVVVEAFDHGAKPLVSNFTVIVVNNIKCEAMRFYVNATGFVTVRSLCTVENSVADKYVLVGAKVELECTAKGNVKDIQYRWSKNGVVVSPWSSHGKLTLDKIQQGQEGVYACLASSDTGAIQSTPTNVVVQEKPVIVRQPKSVSVSLGGTARLDVKATGDPTPTYQWFKNGDRIVAESTALTDYLILPDAVVEDTAEYHCEVKNSVGTVVTNTVELKIVDISTVVVLKLDVSNYDKKNKCYKFIPEEFEKIMKEILQKDVEVTDVLKKQSGVVFCNVTACSSDPCKNDGECEVTDSGYKCTCKPQWTGKTCENDLNECDLPQMCYNSGTCQNTQGSYDCKCTDLWKGARCQYQKDACKPNPCNTQLENCVPSADEAKKYTCVKKSTEVTVVVDTKDLGKWTEETRKKLEELLNKILKSGGTGVTYLARRRRDTTTKIDLGQCTVHIIQQEIFNTTKSKIKLALDCSASGNDTESPTLSPAMVKLLCAKLFEGDASFESCGLQGNITKPEVKKVKPATTDVHIVVKGKGGKALPSGETIDILKNKNVNKKLNEKGFGVKSTSDRKLPSENKDDSMVPIIIGVVAGIVVLALVAAFLVYRHNRRSGGNSMNIMGTRSVMTNAPTSTAVLVPESTNISAKQNMAFESESAGNDNNETFMFEMPSDLKATK